MGLVPIFLLGKSAGGVNRDGIPRLRARRLFVSGAGSAQTSPTPLVVSVCDQRPGRLWDLSLRRLRNLPTVKYWLGLRADVGMCADGCSDLEMLARRWVGGRYLHLYDGPSEKIHFSALLQNVENSSGCVLHLDTPGVRPLGVLSYYF